MEVIVLYGYNIFDSISEFKDKIIKEINNLTAMNVQQIEVVAKGIKLPEELKQNK